MAFTKEDLAIIKAMCQTACPRYPEVPMYPLWASVYAEAETQLVALLDEERDECHKCGKSMRSHFGYCMMDM